MHKDLFVHYPKEEAFVKRTLELIKLADKKRSYVLTPFLMPDKQAIVHQIAGKQMRIAEDGFYPHAESKRLAIVPFAFDGEIDMDICQLAASFPAKFLTISHRDVLGALMQIGLEREQFGDIAVTSGEIGIAVMRSQAAYIADQLTQIHRASVSFVPQEAMVAKAEQRKTMQVIVSSFRLDTLVGALANVSRARAKEMILAGHVKVNHSLIESSDKLCNNNDVISIRGAGRFVIVGCVGQTKKENYVLTIEQYI